MRRALFVLVPVSLLALAGYRLTGGECPIACTLGGLTKVLCGAGACETAPDADADAGLPRGRYVEARTAAVFAGACHFGGQRTTQGREAVCAWSFDGGSWRGVPLAGVDVVVALAAEENLDEPGARRSVAYVAADQPQAAREAALALVRARYGERLGELEVALVPTIARAFDGEGHRIDVPGVLALEGGLLPDRGCCAMPFDVWYEPLFDAQEALVVNHATFRYDDARLGRAFERTGENNGFSGRFAFAREPS
jgi:hypothetical protein